MQGICPVHEEGQTLLLHIEETGILCWFYSLFHGFAFYFLIWNTREILNPIWISPSSHLPLVWPRNAFSSMPTELVSMIWNTCPPVSMSIPSARGLYMANRNTLHSKRFVYSVLAWIRHLKQTGRLGPMHLQQGFDASRMVLSGTRIPVWTSWRSVFGAQRINGDGIQ